MTPKEQYEERKKLRREQADRPYSNSDSKQEAEQLLDIIDRIATALERIADSLEPVNIEHKPYDKLKEKTNEPI